MGTVRDEVLAANMAYSREFGDRARLAMPPGRHFAISPAWTRGSTRPSTAGSAKATHM